MSEAAASRDSTSERSKSAQCQAVHEQGDCETKGYLVPSGISRGFFQPRLDADAMKGAGKAPNGQRGASPGPRGCKERREREHFVGF